jgi:hypothetical protein
VRFLSRLWLIAVLAVLPALVACASVQNYQPNPHDLKYPRVFGGP